MVPIIWNFLTSTMVAKEVSNIRGKRFNHQGWTWPSCHCYHQVTEVKPRAESFFRNIGVMKIPLRMLSVP